MNKLKYIKLTSFSIISFFITLNLHSQELPPIQNYLPSTYGGENQNWAISQSSSNVIYVANNSGLLEYNGAKWKLYPSTNKSVLRSVSVRDDKIYTGCYMDFGYWEKDVDGSLIYTTLIDKLEVPLLDDEQFWNILHFENYVLFQSLSRIYIYDLNENSFKIINSPSKRAVLFKVGSYIYFQKLNKGIFKIENGEAILVSDESIFRNQEIIGAFKMDKKILFLTEKGEFYFLDNEKLTQWKTTLDTILKPKNIYSSVQLSDGSFVLGTISNGVFHLNSEGDLIQNITKEKGLLNNTVLSVFEDYDKNIWLGLDNGISTINLNSPFTVYTDVKGTIGSVYTSVIHQNNLYIGTNQGLFYKPVGLNNEFQFIANTKGQVWCLKVIDGTLFCGHNAGTFVVENTKAVKISDFPGTWDIKQIENKQNILLQGNYSGLSILQKINNKWQFKNKIEGFNISSRFIEFISSNELLINHEYKAIFKLSVNNDFTKVANQTKLDLLGLESSLVKYNKKILHASNKGIYQFNNTTNQFKKDSLLSKMFYDTKDPIKRKLITDSTNKLWGFSDKNIVLVKYDNVTNKPKKVEVPVQKSYRTSQLVSGFESLNHLYDEIYLIGNTSGFTILNLDRLQQVKNYKVSINSVYSQQLNNSKQKLVLNESGNLKSLENNIYIEYSVAEFDKNTEVNYQYRLKGSSYNDWSEWTDDSDVTFKNLSFGSYNFEVKSRVGNTTSENIATYTFAIERPFYFSNLAIIIYGIILILLFLIIHNFYKRYYTKQKQKLIENKQREFVLSKLESDKVIMKLKNEKLQNDIESKTRELSASTMSILRKNELLNIIKKELINVKDEKEVKKVLRIIDKNLTNKGDWQLFEEAFNNIDRGFFKKIKDLHPNLTSNDLRLCTYLRLNLSSKEIAPLLNISPRSVEIKRYRLRKKMTLSHEKSLTKHILEI